MEQVLHFAGPVQYTTKDWLLKNSDPMPETMHAAFGAGSLPLVRRVFAKEIAALGTATKAKAATTVRPDEVSEN